MTAVGTSSGSFAYKFKARERALRWIFRQMIRYALKIIYAPKRRKNFPVRSVVIWPPCKEPPGSDIISDIYENIKYYSDIEENNIIWFYWTKDKSWVCVHAAGFEMNGKNIPIAQAEGVYRSAVWKIVWKLDNPEPEYKRESKFIVGTNRRVRPVSEWLRFSMASRKSSSKLRFYRPPETRFASCALVATGPSSVHFHQEAGHYDIWIGANQIILDRDLCENNPPYAICILDPYYFGRSAVFQQVRERLVELLCSTQCLLITTVENSAVIQRHFPRGAQEKCRYVLSAGNECLLPSWGPGRERVKIARFGNVLTDLLLPISCSAAGAITLYGCDGRPPSGVGNYPKAPVFKEQEQRQWGEIGGEYSEQSLRKEFENNDIYTKYVVEQCLAKQTTIKLRGRSWNRGLANLSLVENLNL